MSWIVFIFWKEGGIHLLVVSISGLLVFRGEIFLVCIEWKMMMLLKSYLGKLCVKGFGFFCLLGYFQSGGLG